MHRSPTSNPITLLVPKPPPEMDFPSNEDRIAEHRIWLAGIAEEGRSLFADVGNLLTEVDELLLRSDALLNYSQPPMAGKLGLRFWKRHRPDQAEPVVVVWHQSPRTGRFWPKQVNGHLTKRVCRRGAFEVNADVTAETVAIIDKLLMMRKSLAMLLYRTRQSVSSLKMHQKPVLEYQRKRLTELQATSEKNLDRLYGERGEHETS